MKNRRDFIKSIGLLSIIPFINFSFFKRRNIKRKNTLIISLDFYDEKGNKRTFGKAYKYKNNKEREVLMNLLPKIIKVNTPKILSKLGKVI